MAPILLHLIRMPNAARKKVIWSLDPFETPSSLLRQTGSAIRALAARVELDLQAVYVLSPSQLNVSLEFSGPWMEQFRPVAEAALDAVLKRLRLDDIGTAQVVIQPLASTSHAVDALIDYVRRRGVDFVFATTHGRKGVKRMLMGSFVETLLLRTPVPVVTVGPRFKKGERTNESPDHILYPTDLTGQAMDVFRSVVAFARETRCTLTLFHAIPHPVEPILQSGAYLLGGSWVPVRAYFTNESDRMKRKAEAWARWARNQKVQTDLIVESRLGAITDGILEAAERKRASWIVMEAESGPVSAALLGSITRQVIRQASMPVIVMHPQKRRMAAKAQRRKAA